MTSMYDQDLAKNQANFAPLTPLTFLERAAYVYPDRLSVVHGTQSFTWKVGSSHTLATTSPQAGATGTRAQFSSWSDSGTISHSVTASASITTYTAAFNTQYLVTTALSPDVAGTVTVLPSSSDGYYNAGSPVQLTASPAGGYAFSNFTGTVAGAANPDRKSVV